MDKSTEKILILGGLGLAAWYILSKNKSSETTTGGQSKSVPFEKDAFGMPMVRNDLDKIGGVPKKPIMPTIDRDLQKRIDEITKPKPYRPKLGNEFERQIFKEPTIKPPLGKYRFKQDRIDSQPFGVIHNIRQVTANEPPKQIKSVEYKKGDVINVNKLFWDISKGEYSIITTLDGLRWSFPLAALEKVDDSIPESTPKITINTAGGMAYFAGKRPLTIDNLLM